jgi:hypothetical protein
VGWFLQESSADSSGISLIEHHRRYWAGRLRQLVKFIFPDRRFFIKLASALVLNLLLLQTSGAFRHHIPNSGLAWTPTEFSIRLPYPGSAWKTERGALSGIKGSFVRFSVADSEALQNYLFFIPVSGDSVAIPCTEICELTLTQNGRYAFGNMFHRSAFFPVQVQDDQIPRGVLLADIKGEFSAGAVIQLQNVASLKVRGLASDDIRVESVEIVHRYSESPDKAENEVLFHKDIRLDAWKEDFEIPLSNWKGGQHQLFLRVRDQKSQIDSTPLTLLYADEETMKEKRLLSLRALIDEWVHVLGDLIDSEDKHQVVDGLENRLSSISYDIDGDAPMIAAYARELKALSSRIQKWLQYSPDMSGLPDLIRRTERQILYGLSLIFQEKTGDIQATQKSLSDAKGDLAHLLEQIKSGKLDAGSPELEKAFSELTKKLQELQSKIKELPSGPQDELLNRDALEAQMQESESLADRIEAIKKQIAGGDSKGAMRELESLLNQLSILTKEMERSLDQWKENVDRGSIQASQKYAKALEDLIKKQEKLLAETEALKNKAEKMKEESSKKWLPEDPKKVEQLQKAFDEKSGVQKEISDHFQKAREAFDKQVGGGEWNELLRSDEAKMSEEQAAESMVESQKSLHERRAFDSVEHQTDVLEHLKKSQQNQQNIQQQLQSVAQSAGSPGGQKNEHIETIVTEGKAEKERLRKIMDSLQQKVDDQFQKSHEKYFEDLLQR